jgi:hypothetical protein
MDSAQNTAACSQIACSWLSKQGTLRCSDRIDQSELLQLCLVLRRALGRKVTMTRFQAPEHNDVWAQSDIRMRCDTCHECWLQPVLCAAAKNARIRNARLHFITAQKRALSAHWVLVREGLDSKGHSDQLARSFDTCSLTLTFEPWRACSKQHFGMGDLVTETEKGSASQQVSALTALWS